ncbi:hypothetical protein, partial [Carnobacterium mobile]
VSSLLWMGCGDFNSTGELTCFLFLRKKTLASFHSPTSNIVQPIFACGFNKRGNTLILPSL